MGVVPLGRADFLRIEEVKAELFGCAFVVIGFALQAVLFAGFLSTDRREGDIGFLDGGQGLVDASNECVVDFVPGGVEEDMGDVGAG